MTKKYNGALFIDLDGTIMRWSGFMHVFDELVNFGVLEKSVNALIREVKERWQYRQGSFQEYLNRCIEIYDINLPGIDPNMFNIAARLVFERTKKNVYRYTRHLVKSRLIKNWYICIVSGSPDILVSLYCDYWGIHDYFATTIEIDPKSGLFTGKRLVVDGATKSAQIKKLMEKPPLQNIDPQNIIACGDTAGDIAMMESVASLGGRVICFNPAGNLAQKAIEENWLRVTERKNLVDVRQGRNVLAEFIIRDQSSFLEDFDYIIRPNEENPFYL